MPADAFNRYLPAGHDRRTVRDFLRRYFPRHAFSARDIVEWFGEDITNELLVKRLIKIARDGNYSSLTDTIIYQGKIIPGHYRVAARGQRFGAKSLIPPISRAKANQIVADMLERARAINWNPEFLFYVREIRIFGSYLTDAKKLGDVDVGVDVADKRHNYKNFDCFHQAVDAYARAKAPHRDFYGAYDEWEYCRKEVRKLLKNSNRYLSLFTSDMSHIKPQRVIFSEKTGDKTNDRIAPITATTERKNVDA